MLDIPDSVTGKEFREQGNKARTAIAQMFLSSSVPRDAKPGFFWNQQLSTGISLRFCYAIRQGLPLWADIVEADAKLLTLQAASGLTDVQYPRPTADEITEGESEGGRLMSPRDIRAIALVHSAPDSDARLIFVSSLAPPHSDGRFWFRDTDYSLWISVQGLWVQIALLGDDPRYTLPSTRRVPEGTDTLLRRGEDTASRLWSAKTLHAFVLSTSLAAPPLATSAELTMGTVTDVRGISPSVFKSAILALRPSPGSTPTLTISDVNSSHTTPGYVTGALISEAASSAARAINGTTPGLLSGQRIAALASFSPAGVRIDKVENGKSFILATAREIVVGAGFAGFKINSEGVELL